MILCRLGKFISSGSQDVRFPSRYRFYLYIPNRDKFNKIKVPLVINSPSRHYGHYGFCCFAGTLAHCHRHLFARMSTFSSLGMQGVPSKHIWLSILGVIYRSSLNLGRPRLRFGLGRVPVNKYNGLSQQTYVQYRYLHFAKQG